MFVEHGDHAHGSGGSLTGGAHPEPESSEHEGDEVFVQHDENHAHGSGGSIVEGQVNLVSDCSMDLGLNWVDISDHHHEADIGLEWVDISEPKLSTDIGLHWHDISKPELKADLGIEWHDISETKLDGDIGLHWHDMHFEEMHIEAGPCDCDDLGDAMLLQE